MKVKPILLFVLLMSLQSCVRDDINLTCADPLGSDEETLKDKQLSCFQDEYQSCFWIEMNTSLPILRSLYKTTPDDAPLIYDVGEVACLSEVTLKPETDYHYAHYAKLRHGYVFKMADGTFGRLYIYSWTTIRNGIVTEIEMVRQYSY